MIPTIDRRHLLRAAAAIGTGAVSSGAAGCSGPAPDADPATPAGSPGPPSAPTAASAGSGRRVLLAYFSRPGENYHYGGRRDLEVGNTERLATMIAARIDCDVHRIEAADPYPDSYDETVDRNVAEQRSEARPALAHDLPDTTGYDVLLLGSPVWNVRPPRIVLTFVEGLDLSGTIVVPFVTHAVSSLGQTEDDYAAAAPDAVFRAGLAVRGEEVTASDDDVDEWVSTVLATS